MKLIINADDFGLTRGVNLGIIEAFQQGIVRSTTLMAGMHADHHASALSRENPELQVGIHLRLTAGKPMADHVPTLQDHSGQMHNIGQFFDNQSLCPKEIETEFRAQIEHFLRLGVTLSHIDGHHHCHLHPLVAPVAQKLAAEYQVPLRPGKDTILYNGKSLAFSDQFYGDDLTVEQLLNVIQGYLGKVQVLELMAHPAMIDEPLLKASRYAACRTRELAILTDPTLTKTLESMGVSISDYRCFRD